ncbi:hypothetical protein GOBAR_DD27368 [Gossypium barbadense]|nr:hypothetical protein GOBAR_DD27368 [Gossypium barbadense]
MYYELYVVSSPPTNATCKLQAESLRTGIELRTSEVRTVSKGCMRGTNKELANWCNTNSLQGLHASSKQRACELRWSCELVKCKRCIQAINREMRDVHEQCM